MKKLTLLILSILVYIFSVAQGTSVTEKFILIQKFDQINLYPITESSSFSVTPDEEFIISDSETDDIVIDLKEVNCLGITTKISDSNHDIINDMNFSENTSWSIMTLNGTVVSSSNDGRPDLSTLEKGQVYILKIGSVTYKYVSL